MTDVLKTAIHKIILASVIVFSLSMFFWSLAGNTLYEILSESKELYHNIKEETDNLYVLMEREDELQRQWQALEERHIRLLSAFPLQHEQPSVFKELEQLLDGYSKIVDTLNIGHIIRYDDYSSMELIIKAEGTEKEIENLLRDIESTSFFQKIEKMDLNYSRPGICCLELASRIYFRNSEENRSDL